MVEVEATTMDQCVALECIIISCIVTVSLSQAPVPLLRSTTQLFEYTESYKK